MTRILLVEDDPTIVDGLKEALTHEGYDIDAATDGETALEKIGSSSSDLVILDLGLPRLDGLEVLRRLRSRGVKAPVLVLSARSMELDKVRALDLGADDYMTKPFGLSELTARIRALVRRTEPSNPTDGCVQLGDLSIDTRRHRTTKDGRPIVLTTREYRLIEYLHQNRGMVLSRDQILDSVWGVDCASGPRTVDVHMAKLRKKIEDDPEAPRYIITVRAAGYKLED